MKLPPPASAKVYELTDWGRPLESIVIALGTWALEAPPSSDQVFVSADSAMLTIRTYYVPTRAARTSRTSRADGDASIRIELRDHGAAGVFGVRLTPVGAEVTHAGPESPDAVLRTTTAELLAAFGQNALPADSANVVTGDRSVVHRLVEGIRVPVDDRESGTMGTDDAD